MSRRKPRPEPILQGSLADIYKWFFGRLIYLKPEQTDLRDWMETLFDFKNRDIVRYTARKPFKMPGLLYTAACLPTQGLGYREVPAEAVLWVRTDARDANAVDVEGHFAHGGAEQVFKLNSTQWGWVQLNLVEAERERKA